MTPPRSLFLCIYLVSCCVYSYSCHCILTFCPDLVFSFNSDKVKWDEGATTKARHVNLQPINVANDQPSENADDIREVGLEQYVTTEAEASEMIN
jgi:hypothetical protein